MKPKTVLPYAPILVESIRSIGYSFETALADIIDNSIGKRANEINVFFSSKDPQYVAVVDNGEGMTEEELESAMKYGSRSSLDAREKRLGNPDKEESRRRQGKASGRSPEMYE